MTISDIVNIQASMAWSQVDKAAAKSLANAMTKIKDNDELMQELAKTALLIKAVSHGGM